MHPHSIDTTMGPRPGQGGEATPLVRRIGLLALDSWRTLLRFKSFFILIVMIFGADRLLRPLIKSRFAGLRITDLSGWAADLPQQVFLGWPVKWGVLLANPDTLLILMALFFFKQTISLWPSSDMRRMHRMERSGFGLWQAMVSLTWRQVAWDALALGMVCLVAALWVLFAFGVCRIAWSNTGAQFWLLVFLAWAGAIVPQVLAGFSFSSKLAVIQGGGVAEKLRLLWMIYGHRKMMVPVWGFFTLRFLVEAILVAIIPGLILLTLDTPWIRILLAALLATPVYAFLKMISFKFFLDTYSRFDIVRAEYGAYFDSGRERTSDGPATGRRNTVTGSIKG